MRSRNQGAAAVVLAAVLCALLGASPSNTHDDTDYVIRVTSEVEGKEVKFDAAVLFVRPGAALQTLALETPFEMNGSGLAVSAMFVAQGDAMIKVQLVGQKGDKQVSSSTAGGRSIVVGDNLMHDVSGFISSFGR